MSISIKLLETDKQIANNINLAIAKYLNDLFLNKMSFLVNSVKSIIPNWIMSQPEILSLMSSDPSSLAGQFGIRGGADNILSSIISSVVDSTEVKFVKFSNTLKGGLEFNFQPSSFANLLALPAGHTIYQDGDLHWLEWLLKRGDSIIVTNYTYNPSSGLGRSGLGNMIPGGAFRVPPQFSGTEDNNFITRALIGPVQEKHLADIFSRIIK
jgi:hypothetical protein